ncbi:MAG: beta-ketoacyl-ACP synthase II [Chitinophagaceae bacterium]|nr:beta-ketoacyl-ACP synthase II [Oligoflexus sp.]
MAFMNRRVVITGLGAITPLGVSLFEIENSLKESRSGVKAITLCDTRDMPVTFAGEARGFVPENFLETKEIRRNDRFIQMCLAASDLAVKDSGIGPEPLKRAGVAIGVGLGGLYTIEEASVTLANSGAKKISPFLIPSILSNLASGQVSIRFGAKGPNFAISSACASGSQAIGHAYREIQSGRRDVWIAGGAEAPISTLSIAGFAAARALSKRNDDPIAASRPFDQGRDGFVLGEGAGTVVVESLDSALARDAKIYAEIVGFGIASDAHHITEPHPRGEGAFLAMEEAIEDAGIRAMAINYVNAHATSTSLGDHIEGIAMQRIFKTELKSTLVSSTKSLMGHACGAAGAIEAIFCSLMLDREFIAPAFNLENISEEFTFQSPSAVHLKYKADLIMNNSFGFGGVNTSMILKRFEQ